MPRLHRFLNGKPGVVKAGSRFLIPPEVRAAAERQFGVIRRIDGLTRTETQVLVALSRRPRGLVSARQVASAARVSPTAASRALVSLERAGYVTAVETKLFDGDVVVRPVHQVRWESPKWQAAAPLLADAILPDPQPEAAPKRVPARLANVFWTGDASSLDLRRHPGYAARRIVNEGRHKPEALSFLGRLPADDVRHALKDADPAVRARG